MLFGQPTKPISDFLPRLLAHIDGVDVDMATTYLMDAAIQFARESRVLREILCVELVPCQTSYRVETKWRTAEVLTARLFSCGHQIPMDGFTYHVEDGVLYTREVKPREKLLLELEFATTPRRDEMLVPAFFYEDWVEAVVALALSRLYLQTDNQWYNQGAANTQMQIYQQALRAARFSRITKHKAFSMRLRNQRSS